MEIFNEATLKMIRGVIITFVVTACLAFLGMVGKSGLRAMIQNEAKVSINEILKDTTIQNKDKIERLEELVSQNKNNNNDTEKKLLRLEEQLKGLQESVKDLKEQNAKTNEKLDKLTTLLIEFIQSQK